MKKVNVMLDLETVGTSPGCGILSIGACTFQDNLDEPVVRKLFRVGIEFDSLSKAGFVSDSFTLAWWENQSKEAYDVAFGGTTPIAKALVEFSQWLDSLKCEPVVWGNGADFDNAILAFTYTKMGMVLPWKYKNSRCYRTLKEIHSHIPQPVFAGVRHNSLVDAVHQAQHAELILDWIQNAARN